MCVVHCVGCALYIAWDCVGCYSVVSCSEAVDPGCLRVRAPHGSLSHLPRGMIPAFKPDINEYTKRLEFLAGRRPMANREFVSFGSQSWYDVRRGCLQATDED